MKVISSRVRRRRSGSCRKLTPEQEDTTQQLIIDKTPDQLEMKYALWTRKAVLELIEDKFGIKLSIRRVGSYLSSWEFSPQKALKRADEQSPSPVRKWLEETYPAIKEKVKEDGAEIYWGDETGVRGDSQHGRGYAPIGKTPVIRLSAKRSSTNMISAITNQGKMRFQMYDGRMNADQLIQFMRRVIRDAKRKVFMILDNLRMHYAKRSISA